MEECFAEAEVKLEKFSSSNNQQEDSSTTNYLLNQLDVLDAIENAILLNPSGANRRQLDTRLWRLVIYPQIDSLRRQLSTGKSEDARLQVANRLDNAILSHLGRLGHMIGALTTGKKEAFESEVFLSAEFPAGICRLLFRLAVYSGDLVRYRCSNNRAFHLHDNFSAAKEFYQLAHRLNPVDGSVFNQLAVIESLSSQKSAFKMIFYYSRALGSVDPFPVAKENLSRFLKKPECLQHEAMQLFSAAVESHSISIDSLVRMLGSSAEEGHYLFASILAIAKYFNFAVPGFPTAIPMTAELSLLVDFNEHDLKFDREFAASLIGSSFIPSSVQERIMSVLSGGHATIQFPPSDNEL